MSTTHFPLVSTCFLNSRSIVTNYIRVYRTFNNTTVVVTGRTGNVITWSSAGACGFRGARKRAPFAAQVVAETVRAQAVKKGVRTAVLYLEGAGRGRERRIRAIFQVERISVKHIRDITPLPHNGCRPPKRRRVLYKKSLIIVSTYFIMPIGIPKVLIPGVENYKRQWVELYQRLSLNKIVLLTQEIDIESTHQVIRVLLYCAHTSTHSHAHKTGPVLSKEEACEKDMILYVNAWGGSFRSSLLIVDIIDYITKRLFTNINTVNLGIAASSGSFVIAAGKKNNRLSLPHARFLLRQPERDNEGQAHEVVSETNEMIRLRRKIRHRYSKFTGQSLARIATDLNRNEFISAKCAVEYGLIDSIG
jgi:ATP-dependent Clp protease protease subunit